VDRRGRTSASGEDYTDLVGSWDTKNTIRGTCSHQYKFGQLVSFLKLAEKNKRVYEGKEKDLSVRITIRPP